MHSVGISLFKFSGAAGSNNWLIDKMVKLQLSKKKKREFKFVNYYGLFGMYV